MPAARAKRCGSRCSPAVSKSGSGATSTKASGWRSFDFTSNKETPLGRRTSGPNLDFMKEMFRILLLSFFVSVSAAQQTVESVKDFGVVNQGQKLKHAFPIRNT